MLSLLVSFHRCCLVSLCLLTLSPGATAQQPVSPKVASQKQASAKPAVPLSQRLEACLAVPVLKNAVVGAMVRSLDSGKVLFERNPDLALMPASNMKLLTAAAATGILGPDFRFKTALLRTGTLFNDGTLSGDLYLRGSGDPSLTSADLKALAAELYTLGVRRFNGKIIADSSCFDEETLGRGWSWDNEPFYYQAQVSGLNCDGNALSFTVRPGVKPGAPVEVLVADIALPTGYVTIDNRALTGSAGGGKQGPAPTAKIAFERVRAQNRVLVNGTIAADGMPVSAVFTIENPARYTAFRFYEMLLAAGISAGTPRTDSGKTPATATLLVEHSSEPLSTLLARFLKPSDNLYGECLLRTLGAVGQKEGSWEKGGQALTEYLTRVGVKTDGLLVADGSGLSRINTLTPRLLIQVLTLVEKSFTPEAKTAFLQGLPLGGVDGTLRNRFKDTPAEGRVQAKTGTLTGVSALSGYITTRGGERLAFSLLMNHFAGSGSAAEARKAQDDFVLSLLDIP